MEIGRLWDHSTIIGKMKTIVLSDLHIGDPRHEQDHQIVKNALCNLTFDRLVLNGDILDLWWADLDSIRKNELFVKLCEIAQSKEVIWIIGNHDCDARYDPDIMPRSKMCDFYEIRGARNILILHGNSFYPHEDRSWYTRLVSNLNLVVWKITKYLGRRWDYEGFDFQSRVMRNGFWYHRYVHMRRKELLKRYSICADVIIMGHTHLVGYCGNRNAVLYDAGSSTKTRTYVEIADDIVSIHKIISI